MSNISTDTETVNDGAVFGVILQAVAAGVPQSLLLPVRPWNKPDKDGKNAGKAPAYPDPAFPDGSGPWIGLERWQEGNIRIGRLLLADEAGANCGLLLGVPATFPDGQQRCVVAIDLDLIQPPDGYPTFIESTVGGMLYEHCARRADIDMGGLAPMGLVFREAPFIRKTVEPRGLFLATLPADAETRKIVWGIGRQGHDGAAVPLGRVELLAKGQQCVIGGIHHSGNRIRWDQSAGGDKASFDVPHVRQYYNLPAFDSFDQLVGELESAFAARHHGPQLVRLAESTTTDHTPTDATDLAPTDLTVDRLADAFLAMRNPATVTRETYKDIGLAAGATVRGIEHHHGPLSQDQEDRLADVWATWALRHEDAEHCGDWTEERSKWTGDFRPNGCQNGFDRLRSLTESLGADWCRDEFDAQPRPEGAMPDMDAMSEHAKQIQEAQNRAEFFDRLGVWDAGDDDYQITPRQWLLGNVFCRQFLSSLLADGGVGKTATRLAQLISLAIGRSLTGETVHCRCRVLILSLEDSKDELRRRVYAVMRYHGVRPDDVRGWLFLAAPKGLKLMEKDAEGSVRLGKLGKFIGHALAEYQPDVISLDPFVKAHSLEESDNSAIDDLCTFLADMAITYNCAIDLPHHTRKGVAAAGDAQMGRGASSMVDAARLVFTLTRMSPDEAKQFGLDEAERRSLVRMDPGKVNIAPPAKDARWFRLVGVPLGNGTERYPLGDNVQTVVPWTPPSVWQGVTADLANRILDDIDAGLTNGSRYSNHNRAGDRAASAVVQRHLPAHAEKQARDMVATWIKNGVLELRDYDDPTERKIRQGLYVVCEKRPASNGAE